MPASLFASDEDETSLSRYKVVDEDEKLPTLAAFQKLEDETRLLFSKDSCEELSLQAGKVADTANRLSNIIRQGLEPFYDANRDDQKIIPTRMGTDFQELIDAETTANNLLLIRNEFWIKEAICLIELGQRDQGINKLFRALDFVDPLKQADLWKEARETIWSAVGYK